MSHESVTLEGLTLINQQLVPVKISTQESTISSIELLEQVASISDLPIILPGHVETHSHGYKEISTLHLDEDNIDTYLLELLKTGVAHVQTAILADSEDVVRRGMDQLIHFQSTVPEIISLFSEGPHANPHYSGCQNAENMFPFSRELLEKDGLYEKAFRNNVPFTIMIDPTTMDQSELTIQRTLREWQNLHFSLGHSPIDHQGIIKAIEAGVTGFTHVGNASKGIVKQRQPVHEVDVDAIRAGYFNEAGMKDFPFFFNETHPPSPSKEYMLNKVYLDIILDGIHVHPSYFIHVLKRVGAHRIIPVTDQAAGAGTEPGTTFNMCGYEAQVIEVGESKYDYHGSGKMLVSVLSAPDLSQANIAAGTASYHQLLRNMYKWIAEENRLQLPEDLKHNHALNLISIMATNAHRKYGIDDRLSVENEATFVIYDQEMKLQDVYHKGKHVAK